MGRRSLRLRVFVGLISATALPAPAAGFGLELGGNYTTEGAGFDAAVDARIPSDHFGSFEVRGRVLGAVRSLATPPDFALVLMPRYRTPYANFGAFAFTFAGGVGAMAWTGCRPDTTECLSVGPAIEVSPTLSLRKSDVVQPYVALNGLASSMLTTSSRLYFAAGLSLGVAFEFGGKPAKPIPEKQPLLPAVPTEPVQSSGEPPGSPLPSPTVAPTQPITPPQDAKTTPPSPSSKLMPKDAVEDEEPVKAPPASLTPASAPATTPSP